MIGTFDVQTFGVQKGILLPFQWQAQMWAAVQIDKQARLAFHHEDAALGQVETPGAGGGNVVNMTE